MKVNEERTRAGRGRYTSEGFVSDPEPLPLPDLDKQAIAFLVTIGFFFACIITAGVMMGGL